MAKSSPQMLSPVYREIAEILGLDVAISQYRLFRGQQISFPMRFFDGEWIRQAIIGEYDGKNMKALALKYGYSEKTVRRMLKK